MATITIGGLATGLDTNKIIDQMVALERRPLDALQTQRETATTRQQALQTFNAKVLAFLTAVDGVRDGDEVIARAATSSDTTVLTAKAGAGASVGTTSLTVLGLARNAIATAANGKTSASATVATGAGSFVFRVGSGDAQTVAVDATTTLQGLATKINALDAGVSASVVNIGTAASPDYRLRVASTDTGVSSNLTIVTDNTTLGVAVTQTALNASFSVPGFADPLAREHNTFDDVIPGVTVSLAAIGGPVTVAVATDVEGATANVQKVVNAFNDIVNFVADESRVTQDPSKSDHGVVAGPLAFDGTIKNILSSLHAVVSGAASGVGDLTILAQVGITTARDGTLAFDSAKLATALTADSGAVASLFGGKGTVGGVGDRLHDYLTNLTKSGGLVTIDAKTVTDQIAVIDEQLAAGQRHLDDFESSLRATFTHLELLVANLQTQSGYLSALANLGGTSGK
jgi:flagellar hook-associated protein 2